MTIRTRLLLFLLPPLIIFVTFLSLFFYVKWYDEIIETFRTSLATVVTNCAQIIDSDEHQWIDSHTENPEVTSSEIFKYHQRILYQIKKNLPITHLYTIRIKPVQKGELVILNQPNSSINHPYDGTDPAYAYRRVYVIDGSAPPPFDGVKVKRPGEYDFSECGEHSLYYTKETMVSPIYKSRVTGKGMLSGFAPIINKCGHVTALVGADISMSLIEPQLRRSMFIMLGSLFITIFLVVGGVFFVANRISKPARTLTDSALALAAGEYSRSVSVKGPREIVDLANTFNTMSECLQEHMARLKENSLLRERLYGEYECCVLLQHHMLQQVVDSHEHSRFAMRSVSFPSPISIHGQRLIIDRSTERTASLKVIEAASAGFDSMYELLTRPSDLFPTLNIDFSDNFNTLAFESRYMPAPLVWSQESESLIEFTKDGCDLNDGDYIFLCNGGFVQLFEQLFDDDQQMNVWFTKILRHFAVEGLDACTTILTNELSFLVQKHHLSHDVNVLCIQIKRGSL